MLRKVKLYGQLAEFIGHKEFDVFVDNVGQAVSFLIHNFPELELYMSPKYYQVKVGNYSISEEEVCYPVGKEDIHFVPVISGSGGVGRILGGAALIGLGLGPLGAKFAFGTGLTGTFIGKAAVFAGGALVLGGVSEMLFPMPSEQQFASEEDPRLSFSFSGVQNTSRAGTPVPIVYGEIFTGSVVISAAIDNNQIEG